MGRTGLSSTRDGQKRDGGRNNIPHEKTQTSARRCAGAARLDFFQMGLHTRVFTSSFFRMRRSSMKQSPEVVQRTQPIMMITFMSIGAGSCPAGPCTASDLYTKRNYRVPKRYSKKLRSAVTILVS